LQAAVSDSFRVLVAGGAAIDPAWPAICAAVGIDLEFGYGLTEAGPVVAMGNTASCPAGSVGRPLPGVEITLDPRGEILVRSGGVMSGYYEDDLATLETVAEGWLHTGDQGRLDDDGFLFISGRLKEAIVTAAGTTVYPEEIEPYYRHPDFAEQCVIPGHGAHGNDIPILLVVPASPALTDHEIAQIVRRLRAAAPSHCRVERTQRYDRALPRTATGKIRRRVLADQLSQPRTHDDVRTQ
jgi:long-chain acyl-CoA synthetase